jgi:aspergillopepsin I
MLTLYAMAALAAASAASPDVSAAFAGRRTFSLHQVAVNVASRGPWHGASEVRRAYLKYGLPVPDSVSRAAGRLELQRQQRPGLGGNGKTSVPVRPAPNDVEFLVPVEVGNHQLQLDLDTGSSDLYVPSAPVSTQTPHPSLAPLLYRTH